MTLLFSDPLFLQHDTGRHHPECADRLRAISQLLEASGLARKCTPGSYQPIAVEAISRLHDLGVVERVRRLASQGGGRVDPDTVVCPESFRVGLSAAGACVAGVDAVLQGKDTSALCLVRPPGHHATPSHSMGFCLFNNIALAADHARKAHGLTRLLIVDWDVHHGNGTQDIFYEDPQVMFLSIHRFGHGFYPGTGAANETGTGKGLTYTLNVPIRHGTARSQFLAQFSQALEAAAERIKPELVLLSAGFDAHVRDPIGSLGLETEDFIELTRQVQAVARVHCQGRLVSCLEGGYHLQALAESVAAHLTELLASPA